jgi:hypothetical protein
MNHNTSEHRTYDYYPHEGLNLSKTLMSLVFPSFSTFVSTPTLNHCHKPRHPFFAKNFQIFGQCNKGFKGALERYMSKNESTKRQSKHKSSRIKHQTCYTCYDKGRLSKDCSKTQTLIHKIVNNNISLVEPKNDASTIKLISSPCDNPHA